MEQLDLRRDETSVLAVIYFPNHPERIAALLKPLHNQLQADEPKLGDHTRHRCCKHHYQRFNIHIWKCPQDTQKVSLVHQNPTKESSTNGHGDQPLTCSLFLRLKPAFMYTNLWAAAPPDGCPLQLQHHLITGESGVFALGYFNTLKLLKCFFK